MARSNYKLMQKTCQIFSWVSKPQNLYSDRGALPGQRIVHLEHRPLKRQSEQEGTYTALQK
jgi:hypothetical protein